MPPIPLTAGQQGIWVQNSLGAGPAYHVRFAYRLGHGLDPERLVTAVQTVLDAHAALRTRVHVQKGELVAKASAPGSGAMVERRTVDAEQVQRTLDSFWQEPFDLAADLPVRALLLDVRDHHVLSVDIHHIVFDNWSMGILLDELSTCYRLGEDANLHPDDAALEAYMTSWHAEIEVTRSARERAIARLAISYSDVPERLNFRRFQGERAAAPHNVRGASRHALVNNDTAEAIRQLAARHACTEYVVYLAAWATLVSIHGQHEDVAVGTPFAQRSRTGADGLVGYFLDSLVVRQQFNVDVTFADTVDATRNSFLTSMEDSTLVAYEDVVRAITGRDPGAPLFAAWFAWQHGDDDLHLEGVEVERLELPTTTAKFDLALFVTQDGQRLRLDLEYPLDAYDDAAAEDILRHYMRLLNQVSARPGTRLHEIDLLDERETKSLVRWGRGPAAANGQSNIHLDGDIRAQAEALPHADAIVHDGVTTSYTELVRRADEWTYALRARGVRPGEVVGVAMERSAEMIAALLGVVGSGAAYVALDLQHPVERLRSMVIDSNVQHAVTDVPDGLTARLGIRPLTSDDVADYLPVGQPIERHPANSALAYVTYTSGSTGRPKGIRMTHQNVTNLLQWQRDAYPQIGLGSRTLQFASLGFDVSAQEIFGTLQTGGTLVLISQEQRNAVHDVMRIVRDARVDRLFIPAPALLEAVRSAVALDVRPRDLRVVVSGSEQLVVTDTLRTFFTTSAPAARLFNEYGPSETHVATAFAANSDPTTWPTWMPIGAPIGATEVRLLDAYGRRTAPGSVGEIYLSGPGLAQGYASMPTATATSFVPDAHGSVPGARVYRTGDLARYGSDGALEYLGRRDSQVKVRGFRIELEEVRSVLDSADGVAQAFVTVTGQPDRTHLVGYWRRSEGSDVTGTGLQAFLANRLPTYMQPAALREVKQFPLTGNGKIDGRALAADCSTVSAPTGQETGSDLRTVEERDPLVAAVATTMAAILDRSEVASTDDFFALGGNSLLANRLVWSLAAAGVAEVSLRTVMEGRTPVRIAASAKPVTSPTPGRNHDTKGTRQRLTDLMNTLEDE